MLDFVAEMGQQGVSGAEPTSHGAGLVDGEMGRMRTVAQPIDDQQFKLTEARQGRFGDLVTVGHIGKRTHAKTAGNTVAVVQQQGLDR